MALNADEALLDALSEAMGGGIFVGRDPDGIEPSRRGDGDGDEVSNAAASAAAAETTSPFYDDSLPPQQSQPLQTAKQERMVLDQMVRHEQRIGKNFTGPKGWVKMEEGVE